MYLLLTWSCKADGFGTLTSTISSNLHKQKHIQSTIFIVEKITSDLRSALLRRILSSLNLCSGNSKIRLFNLPVEVQGDECIVEEILLSGDKTDSLVTDSNQPALRVKSSSLIHKVLYTVEFPTKHLFHTISSILTFYCNIDNNCKIPKWC